MWWTHLLLVLVTLVGLIGISVLKRRLMLRSDITGDKQGGEASPLSRAMGSLVGIAGGIYLSLEMVTAFLHMDVPDRVMIWGIGIDPLAMAAIILTVAQTLFLSLKKL